MKVRIQAFIDAPDRSYAYYPGQVIDDHEHAADWIARGQAIEIQAVLPEGETADEQEGEVSEPAGSETSGKKRKRN